MDKQQFTYQVIPVKDKLYRLALILLHDRQEAEDTLQDVFLKLWSIRQKLNGYNSIEALAMTITRNLCLDKLKSYRHRHLDPSDVHTMELDARIQTPEQMTEISNSMQLVERLIENLPEQQRLVLHLRDVEHYSTEEISAITGLTNGNIRVALSRARKSVRDELSRIDDYENTRNKNTTG